jgi:hypothetical protein
VSRTRLRSSVALPALVAGARSASAAQVDNVQALARQPSVTTDVLYGHNDGLALTLDIQSSATTYGAFVGLGNDASTESKIAPSTWTRTLSGDQAVRAVCRALTERSARVSKHPTSSIQPVDHRRHLGYHFTMNQANDHRHRLDERVAREDVYPEGRFRGRGIVICAGGLRYFTNAYVCASLLRRHGCTLPIQFWHLGPAEMTDEMRHLVAHLDVTTVDAHVVRETHPARTLNGWELKPYAILHCPFEEVLFLDADNVVVRNPEYLFSAEPYLRTGAVFWPDRDRLPADREVWDVVGVEYRDEPEVESGQLLINKQRCWHALNVAMFMNEWSDVYYRYMHGDKETFHLAWRKLGQEYAMPDRGVELLPDTICHHDFNGLRIFQHRNYRKWQLEGDNEPIPDFWLEDTCLQFVDELRRRWSVSNALRGASSDLYSRIVNQRDYMYCRIGRDFRRIAFLGDGNLDAGSGAWERRWSVEGATEAPKLLVWDDRDVLCELVYEGGMFHGQWLKHERVKVVLLPI